MNEFPLLSLLFDFFMETSPNQVNFLFHVFVFEICKNINFANFLSQFIILFDRIFKYLKNFF